MSILRTFLYKHPLQYTTYILPVDQKTTMFLCVCRPLSICIITYSRNSLLTFSTLFRVFRHDEFQSRLRFRLRQTKPISIKILPRQFSRQPHVKTNTNLSESIVVLNSVDVNITYKRLRLLESQLCVYCEDHNRFASS